MALATIARSPNSWVSSLTYGVSPQPEQAPENSNSGSRYWMPRTVPKSTFARVLTGIVSKNATFVRTGSRSRSGTVSRLIARRFGCPIGLTGHASTHSPQPVQSSAYTCSVKCSLGMPAAFSGADWKLAGAPSSASSL